MGNIEKISKINRETLSAEQYFQSLLEGAYHAQLLSEAELEKIQLDCLALLAEKTERFNGGDSSSIRIEKAQHILASVMFTMGVALKVYPSPDDAVAALRSMGVEAVCGAGRKRITRLMGQAKLCHRSLTRHLLQTKNIFYSSTVVDGINGFFKLYDAEFAAQEIHITADYPVYNNTEPLLGIEFILQYLGQLYYENQFCTHFSDEEIHHLLCGYDEEYENLLLNLYEPVLAASLGCVLAGAPVKSLEITPEMQSLLHHHFAEKTQPEIQQILSSALLKLAKTLSFSDSLTAYVEKSLHQLAATIESGAKRGSLSRIFLMPSYPENKPKLTVSYGEKMDNEQYSRVLDLFMNGEMMSDKIKIMKDKIHSLADLEDLLLDAELSADEITVILKSLSPAEVVALMKKHNPAYEINLADLRDCERILCEGLNGFAASLSSEQRTVLEKAVKALELEED